MRLRVRFVSDDRRDEVASLWRALEAEHDLVTTMRSWAWVEAWLKAYAATVDARFALVEDADGVVATVLLTAGVVRRGPIPVRAIWLGTADLPPGEEVCPEYNGLVTRPGCEQQVADALLSALLAERGWDELRLRGFTSVDAEPFLRRRLRLRSVIERASSPTYDIDAIDSGAPIVSGLPREHRRGARRTLNAFKRRGPIEIEWAERVEQAEAIFDELIVLHRQRWQADGLPGVFASARFTAMHRDLIRTLVPTGRVLLARIRCGQETVGCLYGFIDGDRVLCYQSGLRRYERNVLRAGVLCDLVLIEEIRRRGYRYYDLLPGGIAHKRMLSNAEGQLLRVSLRRPRLRYLAITSLLALRNLAANGRSRVRA